MTEITYKLRTESSGIDFDNVGLHNWVTTDVSHILLEESTSIIRQINDRLIAKFKERVTNAQPMDRSVEVTQEKYFGFGDAAWNKEVDT